MYVISYYEAGAPPSILCTGNQRTYLLKIEIIIGLPLKRLSCHSRGRQKRGIQGWFCNAPEASGGEGNPWDVTRCGPQQHPAHDLWPNLR